MLNLEFWSPLPETELVGSQKALILGPALGCSHRSWQSALSFIGEDIKPIVFGLPGHGLTPATNLEWDMDDLSDAVVRIADRLEIRQFTYAGTDLSGLLGYQLALKHRNRLSSLGVLCSSPRIGHSETCKSQATAISKGGMKSIVDATLRGWFTEEFLNGKPEIVSRFAREFLDVDCTAYLQACEAIATFDLWDQISQIEIPTLIVHGSEDKLVSWDDAKRADSLIPDSGLVEITGVGHQAIVEAPEVAIKHISFYARKFR